MIRKSFCQSVRTGRKIAKRFQKQISKQVEENYTKIINELNADGWNNMKIKDDGTHFARAFRPVKPVSNTAQSSAPNWRIAFKVLRNIAKTGLLIILNDKGSSESYSSSRLRFLYTKNSFG